MCSVDFDQETCTNCIDKVNLCAHATSTSNSIVVGELVNACGFQLGSYRPPINSVDEINITRNVDDEGGPRHVVQKMASLQWRRGHHVVTGLAWHPTGVGG